MVWQGEAFCILLGKCLEVAVHVILCGIIGRSSRGIRRVTVSYWRMLSTRSSRGAYQKWVDLTGDDSWSFDSLLPYFKRSAHFTPPENDLRPPNSTALYNSTVYDTTGGPLQVSYPAWVNPISSWLGAGLNSLGLRQLPGLADGNLFGWGYTAFTIDHESQTRSSSEASYLREASVETTNLNVYKNTLAKRINFGDGEQPQAKSVTVNSGGIEYEINAAQEIILSAGVVRFAKISCYPAGLTTVVSVTTTTSCVWHWASTDFRYDEHIGCRRATWCWTEHDGKSVHRLWVVG